MNSLRCTVNGLVLAAVCSCGGESESAEAEQTPSVEREELTASEGESLPLRTVEACLELGGAPIGLEVPEMASYTGDPLVNSSREDACPALRRKLGTVESSYDPNGGLCCEEPPWMTSQECAAVGGNAVPDPGGGDTLRLGCGGLLPPLGTTIGWLCERPDFCFESGLCCRP